MGMLGRKLPLEIPAHGLRVQCKIICRFCCMISRGIAVYINHPAAVIVFGLHSLIRAAKQIGLTISPNVLAREG